MTSIQPESPPERILHLGCGKNKWGNAVGADINPESDADVLCDLNARAFPFARDYFDLVVCEHVLEHLDSVIDSMEEIHRVGKKGARVLIQVPHFSSIHYYNDPTHKHPFALHTLDYFIDTKEVRRFNYSKALYRILRAEFPPPKNAGIFKLMIFKCINRRKDWYERHLAFIFPRHLLEFELEIVK